MNLGDCKFELSQKEKELDELKVKYQALVQSENEMKREQGV